MAYNTAPGGLYRSRAFSFTPLRRQAAPGGRGSRAGERRQPWGTRRPLARLWSAERAITSVEYAILLAMISGDIIMGAEFLGGAVSNEMSAAAAGLSTARRANVWAPPRGERGPARFIGEFVIFGWFNAV